MNTHTTPSIRRTGPRRWAVRLAALALCAVAAGCTTTGSSSSSSSSSSSGRGGVTIFGDIDAGVSSISR